MEQEILIEKGYETIYFSELNTLNNIWKKIINFMIGFWSVELSMYNQGYRKIRWLKLLNTKTGITRIIRENIQLLPKTNNEN